MSRARRARSYIDPGGPLCRSCSPGEQSSCAWLSQFDVISHSFAVVGFGRGLFVDRVYLMTP